MVNSAILPQSASIAEILVAEAVAEGSFILPRRSFLPRDPLKWALFRDSAITPDSKEVKWSRKGFWFRDVPRFRDRRV